MSRATVVTTVVLALLLIGATFLASTFSQRTAAKGPATTDPDSEALEHSTGLPRISIAAAARDRADLGLVTGRIVTMGGTPIADAVVRADDGATTSADASGRFRLTVAPGSSIEASASGFRPAKRSVDSGRGRHDLGDMPLTGIGSAAISVAGSDGSPVAGVRVAWTPARAADEALNLRVHPPIAEALWIDVGETGTDGRVAAKGVPIARPILVRAVLEDGVPIVEGPTALPAAEGGSVAIVVPPRFRLLVESLYRRGEAISPVLVTRVDGAPGARWKREFENQDGFVELLLPEAVYEIGVCPEGRHLLRQTVTMDRERRLALNFERLDVIHLRVMDPAGRPVPSFDVCLGNFDPSPADARRLFDMASYAGRDGAVDVRIPVKERDVPTSRTLIVRAPGFVVGRVTIPWSESAETRHATLQLERGAIVSGRIDGVDAGAEVRLVYRRDPSGATWSWDAPLLDATRAGPGGAYILRGLGPGTYEVRVRGASMDVPVGEVVVAEVGATRFDATYSPSRVEVTLVDAGVEPVLTPLLPGSKWQGGGEVLARESIRGVRRGATMVFDDVAPGRYVIDRIDRPGFAWGASLDANTVELRAGQTFTTVWRPRPAVAVTFRVSPATDRDARRLYAIVRATGRPSFAAALAWRSIPADGVVTAAVPDQEPFVAVVARTATPAEYDPLAGDIIPLAFRTCASPADLDGAEFATGDATVVVEAAGVESARVELVHDELSRVLAEPRVARLGQAVTGLLPGRWRVAVMESGSASRRGETTFDLARSATHTVRVDVR